MSEYWSIVYNRYPSQPAQSSFTFPSLSLIPLLQKAKLRRFEGGLQCKNNRTNSRFFMLDNSITASSIVFHDGGLGTNNKDGEHSAMNNLLISFNQGLVSRKKSTQL